MQLLVTKSRSTFMDVIGNMLQFLLIEHVTSSPRAKQVAASWEHAKGHLPSK